MSNPGGELRVDVLRMSREEIDSMLEQRLLARLATEEPNGNVHIVPMWYLRQGNSVLIPTSRTTRKVAYLREHPRASLVVDQYRGGRAVRGVLVLGDVTIIHGDEAARLNRAIHERYVDAWGLQNGPLAEYLAGDDVTINVSMDEIRSWKVASSSEGGSPFAAFLPLDF